GSEWHLSDIETWSQPRERIVARQAIIVAYTDNDVEVIKRNLKDLAERKNLRFLCPKDFSFHGEEFSRLDLNNFNKIIAGKLKCA
ncbi:hypothetical protein, partial [Bifidobacterium bifidum]